MQIRLNFFGRQKIPILKPNYYQKAAKRVSLIVGPSVREAPRTLTVLSNLMSLVRKHNILVSHRNPDFLLLTNL